MAKYAAFVTVIIYVRKQLYGGRGAEIVGQN
jgi:hypothetical protein